MIIRNLFQTSLFLEYRSVWTPGKYSDIHNVIEGVMAENFSLEVIFKEACVSRRCGGGVNTC